MRLLFKIGRNIGEKQQKIVRFGQTPSFLAILLAILLASILPSNSYADQENKVSLEPETLEVATFAGGCFWCTEADLEKVEGVLKAISGFSGGEIKNPTYKAVASGATQHIEAVQITFDPKLVTYEKILDAYWRHIDPTDSKGQFVDRGPQYRPVIFYHSPSQKLAAIESKNQISTSERFEKPISTEIYEYQSFWPAEKYHQDYFKKNPIRYKYYRHRSGRDQFIRKYWDKSLTKKTQKVSFHTSEKSYSKPSKAYIKNQLTPLQYKITQKDGTELPFKNEYWDNKKEGIYVDIVSGEPLFSSRDKFKSGTGWPSFTKPLIQAHVVEKLDFSLIFPRTEVRSKYADSHLGHVFKDGPEPTGLRYCVNSAALKFIAKDQLAANGYDSFSHLFTR